MRNRNYCNMGKFERGLGVLDTYYYATLGMQMVKATQKIERFLGNFHKLYLQLDYGEMGLARVDDTRK